MGDWRNDDQRQAGFAQSAIQASGVVEMCPHENPLLTGKNRDAAYALATVWFKNGEHGADAFSDLEEVRQAVSDQLQSAELFCQICQGLEL